MRVPVCGDRWWTDQTLIDRVLDAIHAKTPISLIIEGEAKGADKMARNWAERRGVDFSGFPAEWKKFGRAAGLIRNRQQFDTGQPDLVVGFHDNIDQSKGTKDMLAYARSQGCPTRLWCHNPFGDGDGAYRDE